MHIPDGFLSGSISGGMFLVSGGAIGVSLYRAQKTLEERDVPLLGITGAFIFAAQMVNFPIGFGASGHFLGGMLAGILLGPLNALLIMGVVLTLQCLLFADGGLTALGANIFNMGIVGALLSHFVFRGLKRLLPDTRRGFLAASALASWMSIVAASVACAAELAASGTAPLNVVLPAMAGIHALIGVGEAIVTAATLSVLLASRPDLVRAWQLPRSSSERQEPIGVVP